MMKQATRAPNQNRTQNHKTLPTSSVLCTVREAGGTIERPEARQVVASVEAVLESRVLMTSRVLALLELAGDVMAAKVSEWKRNIRWSPVLVSVHAIRRAI